MNDRSVEARDIRQSVIVTGSGNDVWLSFGENGIILPLKRKQFQPRERRRSLGPDERPRELDLLIPEAGKLPFVVAGRENLHTELRAWLDAEADISVYALIGRAGTGKTRLALELCKNIDSDFAAEGPWLAGFLSPDDLSRIADASATRSFAWERRTLLVIDYAAQCYLALARLFDRLAYQRLDTKLRFLLLDREAPEDFGWWHELTSPSLRDEQARLDLFYARRPRQLPDLSDLEERRRLMAKALEAACTLRPPPPPLPSVPTAGVDAVFDAHLAGSQFGNPLSLVMAGVIARDCGARRALALRRLDAARELGARELERLEKLAESRGLYRDTMRHVVGFNGLTGGLPLDGLRKILADELATSHREANLDVLVSLLEQELPSGIETAAPGQHRRLATIQPDLIGEAAIIKAFTGERSKEAEAHEVVRRAYLIGQGVAARALVRGVQDFAYALDDENATEAEKATGQRVMDWLKTLAQNIEDPLQLIPLVSALPAETTILVEAAADWTQRIAASLLQEAEANNDPDARSKAAGWSINLANRLSALGQQERALAAADEGCRLSRALAQDAPDAIEPILPFSLIARAKLLRGTRPE
jgi:hypothetical protein